jgi:hypothetical protein
MVKRSDGGGKQSPPWPATIKLGEGPFARNAFLYAEAVRYIDHLAGSPPRDLSGDDLVRLITEGDFRKLLGGVSHMFIWRRRKAAAPKVEQAVAT